MWAFASLTTNRIYEYIWVTRYHTPSALCRLIGRLPVFPMGIDPIRCDSIRQPFPRRSSRGFCIWAAAGLSLYYWWNPIQMYSRRRCLKIDANFRRRSCTRYCVELTEVLGMIKNENRLMIEIFHVRVSLLFMNFRIQTKLWRPNPERRCCLFGMILCVEASMSFYTIVKMTVE